METAAIFPYSLQVLQCLFLHCYRSLNNNNTSLIII
ncbi:hypothetical protein T06_10302 [Trichinella sp. T6]|nr:hypothetical protein T06_10302 [Trichinella sp. T6]